MASKRSPKKRQGDTAIGDAAVERATGRPPSEWFTILDAKGGTSMTHAALASILAGSCGLSPWWSQMVTVQYERARGLRAVHEMKDGFQISRSRTFECSAAKVFAACLDAERRATWCREALEVTSSRKAKAISTLLYARGGERRVRFEFVAKGPRRSALTVMESKLPSATLAERRKRHWETALTRLERHLAALEGSA